MYGRPAKPFRLATKTAQVIGFALQPGLCSAVVAGLDGKLNEDAELFATPGCYQDLLEAMVERASPYLKRSGVKSLGIGISAAGLFNRRLQENVLAPNMHIIDGRSPARDLAGRLGVECIMENDTNLLCLAERFYGADKGLDNFAVLNVTTGLGLGIVTGGRLLTGKSGMATEIGHITVDPNGRLCGCGNRGCLETLATESALVRAISQRYNMALDIHDVIQLIRSGEIQPDEEIHQTLEYVAIAVAAVINLFNPSTVFVVGKLFDAQENMFQRLLHLVRQRSLAHDLGRLSHRSRSRQLPTRCCGGNYQSFDERFRPEGRLALLRASRLTASKLTSWFTDVQDEIATLSGSRIVIY